MNESLTTQAITLRSIPLQDPKRIVTLFSADLGLISVVVSTSKGKNRPLCEPFCQAEVVLFPKKKELFLLQDSSLINLHLPLREKLSYLNTASSMVKAILSSQLPEKPAPALYQLLAKSLEAIPAFPSLNTLLACFYLKLLLHEGLYNPNLSDYNPLFSQIAQEKKIASLKEMSCSQEELIELEHLFTSSIRT
jgi:DNA repair protein RecO (recombination protein O)